MSQKSVPVSVRLPVEDAEFLSRMTIDGADTPSEKLRAIVAEARRRQLGTGEFSAALRLAHDSLVPTLQIIRDNERRHGLHSELISRLGEWLPDCHAYLVAANGADTDLSAEQLLEIERGLADRVFVLIQSMLQLGVTATSPCYDPAVVADRIDPVLGLAGVISNSRPDVRRNSS
ncbi:MAG: hypothetical protein HKN49_08225 [Gammaproteobacteria bacterium]|nr:hypothetical protein [Gammaproteobacteria bacterium]